MHKKDLVRWGKAFLLWANKAAHAGGFNAGKKAAFCWPNVWGPPLSV